MIDEFYVGYEPEMPPRLAVRFRRLARALVALALFLPAILVSTQERFAAGVFEYGHAREFRGQIVESPYPALRVIDARGGQQLFWLVGPGKHGAAALVRGHDGQEVRLSGTLIQRDRDAMIEIGSAPIDVVTGAAGHIEPLRSRGVVVVEGEIVDSKCHLGVMKPGEGPTHRDCAVRCLLGSIPPMFVPRDRPDLGRLPLVSEDGRPFADAATWAGRRVAVRGEMLQRSGQRFLAASRDQIRLLE